MGAEGRAKGREEEASSREGLTNAPFHTYVKVQDSLVLLHRLW